MRANELLSGVRGRFVRGDPSVEVLHLTDDSRCCGEGSAFFAFRGARYDGHAFADDAVARGARLVVAERPLEVDAAVFVAEDVVEAASCALRRFYFSADASLFKVGITGTNGKTTVAFLLWQFWQGRGIPSSLLSTVFYKVAGRTIKPKNTTPGLFDLWNVMAEASRGGDKRLVMEVSSHALSQRRLGDVCFQAAVFTNLSRDHLDYHGSMEEYFRCKRLLFERHLDGVAVVNADDPYGVKMASAVKGDVITYGVSSGDVRGRVLEENLDGMRVEIDGVCARARLFGLHNLYNILAAYAVSLSAGEGREFLEALPELSAPEGRLEPFEAGGVRVFVDYAHTPDALERVLSELKRLTRGRLIVVFGCGGDRDRGKRPEMGRVATELSDLAVITSDNPRSEDPEDIIREILSGIRGNGYLVEPDRRKAIIKAVSMARFGDVVLVAGKGHEDYQIVGDRVLHFDDREVVREALRRREGW